MRGIKTMSVSPQDRPQERLVMDAGDIARAVTRIAHEIELSQHSLFQVKTTEAPSYRRIAIETMRGSGYVHAAAAACGTRIENGRWCSKARSRWPTIVYFGLWVGGIIPATSLLASSPSRSLRRKPVITQIT